MKRFLVILTLLIPSLIYAQSLEKLSKLRKPKPAYQRTVDWCAKEGDGEDTELSLVKNRIDILDRKKYHVVSFDEILKMGYAKGTTGPRNTPGKDLSSIHKYEGIPVRVEGYLAYVIEGSSGKKVGGIQEGKEACNCHRPKSEFEHVDYHLWLVKKPGDPLSKAIVVEMAPRMRAVIGGRAAKEDTLESDLNYLAWQKIPVRIYGWLMFDGEHVGQLPGHTDNVRRGTLWEIHPITGIDKKERRWKQLY